MEMHKEQVEVDPSLCEALANLLVFSGGQLFSPRATYMTQQVLSFPLDRDHHMHPVLTRTHRRDGGRDVGRCDDILDDGVSLGKVGSEVHFFPAIFFAGVDAGKAKLLEGFSGSEVDNAIYLKGWYFRVVSR